MAIYGTLSANGDARIVGKAGGGGSGGGIYVDCQRLEGDVSGLLSAVGGRNGDTGGPGGGGRIAVHVDAAAQAGHRPGVRFLTSAGYPSGRTAGTAENGTVYVSDSSLFRANILEAGLFLDTFVYADNLAFTNWALDTLTVDDCRFVFGAEGFRLTVTNDVTLRNGTDLGVPGGGVLACGSLSVESSSVLSAYGSDTNVTGTYYGSLVTVNGDMQVDGTSWIKPHAHPTLGGSPAFRMRNLTVAAGGGFNADGTGYIGGQFYGDNGYGPGCGLANGQFGSGGGYGGKGGDETYSDKSGGLPYATTSAPVYPGSGGGANGGGNGGGLIMIEADGNVLMNGTLSANGTESPPVNSSRIGGGSGGGIFVLCRHFSGGTNAVMCADGGNGGTDRAGGGGGGRIAVWHGAAPNQFSQIFSGNAVWADKTVDLATYQGDLTATYGTGHGQDGEEGSIAFFTAPPQGTLFIIR